MSELIDNNKFRQEKLKELIKSLHDGRPVDEVKAEFKKHFSDVTTAEISQIEQLLVKEGMQVEEIQRLCDVHAAVFEGSISDIHSLKNYRKTAGHPVNIFLEENKAIEKLIDEEIRPAIDKYLAGRNQTNLLALLKAAFKLSDINIHYGRKEYLFFPYLEKYKITAPPKVMWGVDDEIRAEIKEFLNYLQEKEIDAAELKSKSERVFQKINYMIFKENNILLPLMEETFTFYDWIKIDEASPEYGYCLIKPTRTWKAEKPSPAENKEPEKQANAPIGAIMFDAGSLTPEEINAILNTAPFDMTFVDAEDKVKYFTQGKERIFDRPLTVIGRSVELCHPPKSVHVVNEIVENFRAGRRDVEEFWIKRGERYVHIRYFAVRDKNNKYLGTLEVTQDIAPIQKIEGEKRLLDK